MNTLIITRGFPGSGKTIFATSWVKESPGTRININRDDIRATLGIHLLGTSEQENMVSQIASSQLELAFRSNLDVIISDTNLPARRVKDFIHVGLSNNYQVEVKDFVVPYEELLLRDSNRENPVGEGVLRDMFSRFPYKNWVPVENMMNQVQEKIGISKHYTPFVNDPSLPHAIIVDIDGTLAHMSDRSPYDYSDKVLEDTLDTNVLEALLGAKAHGNRVIIMSGREDVCQEVTQTWLRNNGVPFDELHMRPSKDGRPDWIVKDELIRGFVENKYYVTFCLDDRQQVVDHYRAMGLKVFQVQPGDF